MTHPILTKLRDIGYRTPLRRLSQAFHRYEFMFTPAQLAFLVRCIDETEAAGGAIVEIGCATGRTTVFLNKHLDDIGTSRNYICVDTFSGFHASDVEYEASVRGKAREKFEGFRVNSKAWFDRNLEDNAIARVRSYAADIKAFDLTKVAPQISFCLVDVDLYQPVKVALDKVYPLMRPGGIIVVDDVAERSDFDGAYQAYAEFVQARGLADNRVLRKLGVIRVPAAS